MTKKPTDYFFIVLEVLWGFGAQKDPNASYRCF